ncbi:MAG TPA: hypothetical protein VME24_09375, partial [Alphaproteobacteria bacterium]|nr:hypothetical protein [Alphaproteobacteria bacterium]
VLQCSAMIDGVTISNQAAFNVFSPQPQFSAQVVGQIAADTNYHDFVYSELDGSIIDDGRDSDATNWLHFGVSSSWTNVGIAFAFSNAPTTLGPGGTTYGEYFIVQIVDSDEIEKNYLIGTNLLGAEKASYGLDASYPYQMTNDQWHVSGYSLRTNDMWFDSPASSLDGASWLSRSDSFTTYLMFSPYPVPPYTNIIPVPMYSLTWSWSGVAVTNNVPNSYSLFSGTAPSPNISQTVSFPIWSTNASYFLFQTNRAPFMKTDSCWLGLAFAIFAALPIKAQTDGLASHGLRTNTFSLSQYDVRDETGEEVSYYMNCAIHRIAMPEILPANLDTNGNWGSATNGLQVSLRFRKREYSIGEMIPAITILRNLEGYPQALLLTNSPSFFVGLTVLYEENMPVPPLVKHEGRPLTNVSPMPSPPHGLLNWKFDASSEKEIVLDLNRFFALTNAGSYTVTAVCRVYSPLTKSPAYEVLSGSASFTLVSATNSP